MRVLPCTLLSLALIAGSPAHAAARKPALTPERITRIPAALASPASPSAVICTAGTPGPEVFLVDDIQPPDDSYFLRARPATCQQCGADPGVWVSSVNLALEFRVPCSQPVEVAVVGPVADTVCSLPDPSHLFRSSVTTMLTAASPGIHTFSVPLGGAVALLADTYLRVTFTADGAGCTDPGTRPRLVTTSACSLCVAWNLYPADTTDLCDILFPGTPVIWANVDSCVRNSLAAVGPGSGRSFGLRLSPNPARSDALIEYALGEPGEVVVEVRDLAGRRVRAWPASAEAAGRHMLRWDGLDDGGRRPPPGLYLVSVRSGSGRDTRSIVLAR